MSINIDNSLTAFILMFGAILVLAFPASQASKNRVAGTRGVDRLRAIWYVFRYDAALEYLGVPGRQRALRVSELKVNLADAASEEGLSPVLARLGRPALLAQEVSGPMGLPTWSRGVLAGMVTFAVTALAHLFALSSFMAAFNSLATSGEVVHISGPAWITFDATMGEAGSVASMSMTSPWMVLLPLLALLLWSRPWRLVTRRATRRSSGATVSE